MRLLPLAAAVFAVLAFAPPAVALAADPVDVDLVAGPVDAKVHIRPGEQPKVALEVRNAGTTAVPGAVLVLQTEDRYVGQKSYSNCWYWSPAHGNLDIKYMVCSFDGELAPGATYHVAETPFDVGVAPSYWKFTPAWEQTWYTADDVRSLGWLKDHEMYGYPMSQGTGSPLRLDPERHEAKPDGPPVIDSNTANNKASGVVVFDGETTPSPSAPPTTRPTTPTSPAGATATTGAGAGTSGGGGGLPVTGVDAVLFGVVGSVLLAVGLGAYLVARRRRVSFRA